MPLTLVCAPAGFGKTTLVSQWLQNLRQTEQRDVPGAWLSLDKSDNHLPNFLTYFTAAIRAIVPGACPATVSMLDLAELPGISVLATTLANELDNLYRGQPEHSKQGFVLVLDDYQAIHSGAVHSLLSALLTHPPRGFHFIICTRQDPSLPLSRLRAQRQIVELRAKDLRFERGEIAALVEQSLDAHFAETELGRLEEQTEGWITGLHLAMLALRDVADPGSAVVQRPPDYHYAMEYLADEVLVQLPHHLQLSLLQTSILDRMSPELCQAVCGDSLKDGRAFLDNLEKANLFLIGLDAQRQWYRYHHLFGRLLQRQLARLFKPDEIMDLHRRASAWFAENGLIEEALVHALSAGDVDGAAQLAVAHRDELMNNEQWQRLNRWLLMLPASAKRDYPELLLAEAWLAWSRQSDPVSAAASADQIEAVLSNLARPQDDLLPLQGEVAALRCMVAYYAVDPFASIQYGERALELVPLTRYRVRSHAISHLAGAYQMSGARERAYAILAEGMEEERAAGEARFSRASGTTCLLNWMEGDLDAIVPRALQIVETSHASGLRETECWGHYLLACVHYQRNNLALAEQEAAAAFAEQIAAGAWPRTYSAAILANTYLAQQRSEEARHVIGTALEEVTARRNESHAVIIRALGAEIAARQGDLAAASRWAASLPLQPSMRAMTFFFAPQLTLPKVLLAQNTRESIARAADSLAQLYDFVTSIHNTRFLIEVLALQALVSDAQGDERAALGPLEVAVSLAEAGGLIRVFVDLGPRMAHLLNALGRRGTSPEFVGRVIEAFTASPLSSTIVERSEWAEALTDRELDVVDLLAQRLSNKEIAEALSISPATVNRHTIHIYQKLNVSSRREAIAKAALLGIIIANRPGMRRVE